MKNSPFTLLKAVRIFCPWRKHTQRETVHLHFCNQRGLGAEFRFIRYLLARDGYIRWRIFRSGIRSGISTLLFHSS